MIRPTVIDDLDPIAQIYAHHVMTGVATFEVTPPNPDQWRRRFAAATERELPFLTTTLSGMVVGYGFCAPWNTRPAQAFGTSSPSSSIQMVRLHLHCTVISDSWMPAGSPRSDTKHGRWLDTLLLQRGIGEVTD